jgi:hypothetical protein
VQLRSRFQNPSANLKRRAKRGSRIGVGRVERRLSVYPFFFPAVFAESVGLPVPSFPSIQIGAALAAALPPDLRKGFAFPGASTHTNPIGSAGRLSLPAEPGAKRGAVCAGKPEAFRKSGGRAAISPTLTRPWSHKRKTTIEFEVYCI